jgi:hypothetical protein
MTGISLHLQWILKLPTCLWRVSISRPITLQCSQAKTIPQDHAARADILFHNKVTSRKGIMSPLFSGN